MRLANAHSFIPPTKPKPMNQETKAKLEAAIVTGYIMLATMLGIAFFGRFIFALITN